MWQKILDLLKAPAFPDDEEKKRRAYALNALHLDIGSAMFGLGVLVTLIGMALNRGKGQYFISPCHP